MRKILLNVLIVLFFISFISIQANAAENQYIKVDIGSGGLYCTPKVSHSTMVVTLAAPNGIVYTKTFKGGGSNFISISEICEGNVLNGAYTFEVKLYPFIKKNKRAEFEKNRKNKDVIDRNLIEPMVSHGHFSVINGGAKGGNSPSKTSGDQDGGDNAGDQQILDDLIVEGSACIGQDCNNGESFGFDTLRLKENNLRIHFEDTSTSASFPTNDWRIIINDSANGGKSYFAIQDSSANRSVFTVEAGAPSNALYVDAGGDVGIGTAAPVVDIHAVSGNTPTLRLEQNGSNGFTPQTWDIAGNEANFFIRDVTNGSELSFRIQPGAPSNSLYMASSGNTGFGTSSPNAAYKLHAYNPVSNTIIVAERGDGATTKLGAVGNQGQFGTVTGHPLKLVTSNTARITLDASTNLVTFESGAEVDINGQFNNASSRELKENIRAISSEEAMDALDHLNPMQYNYKADKSKENYVGFIAEDVPDIVATKDRKKMNPMDVVAILTKVVKEQQKSIKELKKKIEKLEKKK